MVIVWKVTDLAFLKNESGRHIFFNQSTSSNLELTYTNDNLLHILVELIKKKSFEKREIREDIFNKFYDEWNGFFKWNYDTYLYSDVIFSGNRSLLSFQVWAKNISAAYVWKSNILVSIIH